ncbi:MAG: DUF3313 domain-containing protein [Candidatus Omnitrophica bacterium]|nr:DUF3313 domain-containing protein [Candidatus Omnitrophota bacterium]
MKSSNRHILVVLGFLVSSLAGGCQSMEKSASVEAALQPSYQYVSETMISFGTTDFSFNDYDKILIEPVEIYFHPQYKEASIDRSDLNRIRIKFYNMLADSLAHQYIVVNQPGEGVLKIRVALLNIAPSDFDPRVAPFARLKNSLAFNEMGIDAEFIDAQSEEILATFVDMQLGSKIDKISILSRWRDVNQSFRIVVSILTEALDYTMRGQSPEMVIPAYAEMVKF